MNAREIQDEKVIAREIFVQQSDHADAVVPATICSTNRRRDYTLESTADEFCEAADTSLLSGIRGDAANVMRVLRQLEVIANGIAKRQAPRIARFAFEHQRGLVTALAQMHIEAVVRHIQLAIGEPLEIRCARFIQHAREGTMPDQLLACLIGPEGLGVRARRLPQAPH